MKSTMSLMTMSSMRMMTMSSDETVVRAREEVRQDIRNLLGWPDATIEFSEAEGKTGCSIKVEGDDCSLTFAELTALSAMLMTDKIDIDSGIAREGCPTCDTSGTEYLAIRCYDLGSTEKSSA
jgi:hypothetical protein